MKKLLSLVLSAMLVMSTTIVANAAAVPVTDGQSTKTVTINSNSYQPVYRIDVTWEELSYTYTFSAWDPETTSYKTGEGWVDADKIISVENRSNAPVTIDATFKNSSSTTSSEVKGVTAAITAPAGDFTLESADLAAYASSLPKKDLTVTVTGRPEQKTQFTIDDVVIKINKTV